MLKEIQSLKKKYDSIVIDTGGRDSQEMCQALAICDITIIPVIPSDLDITVLNKMILVFSKLKFTIPTQKHLLSSQKLRPIHF